MSIVIRQELLLLVDSCRISVIALMTTPREAYLAHQRPTLLRSHLRHWRWFVWTLCWVSKCAADRGWLGVVSEKAGALGVVVPVLVEGKAVGVFNSLGFRFHDVSQSFAQPHPGHGAQTTVIGSKKSPGHHVMGRGLAISTLPSSLHSHLFMKASRPSQ
jgi:hypothetical protein